MTSTLRSLSFASLLAAGLSSPAAGQCLAESLNYSAPGTGFTLSAKEGMVSTGADSDSLGFLWTLEAEGHEPAFNIPFSGTREDLEAMPTTLGLAFSNVSNDGISRTASLGINGLSFNEQAGLPLLLAPGQTISLTENTGGVWFAVGSPDDGAEGHVDLFVSTSSAPTPTFVTTLTPPVDGSTGARFGLSVSMAVNLMVISCPNGDSLVSNGGQFYVYEFDGTSWVFTGFFVGGEVGNYAFGRVYTDGKTVLAATVLSDDGALNSGKVDIFRLTPGGLVFEGGFVSVVPEERFGFTADVDGDHVIIGTGNGERVVTLERTAGSWAISGETTAPGPGLEFGRAVAVDASVNAGASQPRFYAGHAGFNGGAGAVHVYSIATSGVLSLPTELAGFNGIAPSLAPTSDICAFAGDINLELTDMRPSSFATLVVGFSLLSAPFKGGTLAPSPDLLIAGLPTGAAGTFPFNAALPYGLSGFDLTLQGWVIDADGPKGFSASNALVVSFGG